VQPPNEGTPQLPSEHPAEESNEALSVEALNEERSFL
jgi:hypothetical protein